MLFYVLEHTFEDVERAFAGIERTFTVRKHKNHFVAETFGGLNGKKCRTEPKEKRN